MVQRISAVCIQSFLPVFVALNRFIDSMSTRISYDNTGNTYDVSKIINADASLNLTAYEQYSPLFLSCVV